MATGRILGEDESSSLSGFGVKQSAAKLYSEVILFEVRRRFRGPDFEFV